MMVKMDNKIDGNLHVNFWVPCTEAKRERERHELSLC